MKIRRHQAAVWTCPDCGTVLVSCSLRGSGSRPGWEGKPQEAGVPTEGAYLRLARLRERHRQRCGGSTYATGAVVLKLLDGGLAPLSEEAFEQWLRDLEGQ